MKSIVKNLLLLLGVALVAVSCKDPKKDQGDVETGVIGITAEVASVGNIGRVFPVSFVSFGEWAVESDSPWCQVSSETVSGGIGDCMVKLVVEQNPDQEQSRTAKITITVKGFPAQTLCTLTQSKTGGIHGGRAANRWMSNYMMERYLWNDQFGIVENKLDYDVDPQNFLSDALNRMTGIDDDGGYYSTNERYYYSKLAEASIPQASSMKAPYAAPTTNNIGIQFVYPVPNAGVYYLLVGSVYPDSPSYGKIKRGQYITTYNGANITSANLPTAYDIAMGYVTVPQVKFGLSEFLPKADGSGNFELTPIEPVTISSYNYVKNPVVYTASAKIKETDKIIGYLVLAEFNSDNKDKELLEVFDRFKADNVNEIVVDLRYNGGGDVYSSTVLGTLIAGTPHVGKVYSHMEFNEMRKKKGEKEFFYIGKDPSMNPYQPIPDALSRSLNLNRAYVLVTNFTASASELVINGLRGLGIEVFVIGITTEGKNVGMEVADSRHSEYAEYDFGNKVYQFAPITFYNLNAQGFKDYGEGFKPDFECDETVNGRGEGTVIFDWDDHINKASDILLNAAFTHIVKGSWPTSKAGTPSRAAGGQLKADRNHKVLDVLHTRAMYVNPAQYYN